MFVPDLWSKWDILGKKSEYSLQSLPDQGSRKSGVIAQITLL